MLCRLPGRQADHMLTWMLTWTLSKSRISAIISVQTGQNFTGIYQRLPNKLPVSSLGPCGTHNCRAAVVEKLITQQEKQYANG